MVADIVGGTDVLVSHEQTVLMDGSRSRDPNEPKNKKGMVKFAWTCLVVEGGGAPTPCKGPYVVISRGTSYLLLANVILLIFQPKKGI